MVTPRRVVLAPTAIADLDNIYLYIAENGDPNAAAGQIERLWSAFERLCTFPEQGRKRDLLAPGLYSLVAGNYVVFYLPHDDRIEIVRVIHGRRDIEQEMVSFLKRHLLR